MTASARPRTPPTLLDLAVATAREAAELVARGRASAAEQVDVKSSPVDVVTAVDTRQRGADRRPAAGRPAGRRRAGGGGRRARPGTSGVRWVVDPIDGTVNFLYGLPAYAVSIAAEVDGEVVAGAVLNVATGELFTATAGGGAFLHVPGRPEPVRLAGSRAGVAGADPRGHRLRLPGGAAPGAGRGGRRAAAAGARHPPASAAPRWTSARRRPAGSTPTTSWTSTPGTTPRARSSRPRPGWWSPAWPAGRSPSRWRSRWRRRSPTPFVDLLAELHAALSGRRSAGGRGARLGGGRERRRDRPRGWPGVLNSGPMTRSTVRGRPGVEEVAGARAGTAATKPAASRRAGRTGARRRR